MKCGLLFLSQESCLLGDISYHSYQGIFVDPEEKEALAKDLGVHNKVMLLRNHGAVCCGETIEEAFSYCYHLVLACDAQLKVMPVGIDNLVQIDEDARRKAYRTFLKGGGGVDSKSEGGPDGSGGGNEKKTRYWGVGELEFEALMRNLDNAVIKLESCRHFPQFPHGARFSCRVSALVTFTSNLLLRRSRLNQRTTSSCHLPSHH